MILRAMADALPEPFFAVGDRLDMHATKWNAGRSASMLGLRA